MASQPINLSVRLEPFDTYTLRLERQQVNEAREKKESSPDHGGTAELTNVERVLRRNQRQTARRERQLLAAGPQEAADGDSVLSGQQPPRLLPPVPHGAAKPGSRHWFSTAGSVSRSVLLPRLYPCAASPPPGAGGSLLPGGDVYLPCHAAKLKELLVKQQKLRALLSPVIGPRPDDNLAIDTVTKGFTCFQW
ncbi:hypothetical protein DIPPA_28565 [Diplonema papillatum]|nr:hypothetical protein DIPPA_28565 [Diplonema papillatum]